MKQLRRFRDLTRTSLAATDGEVGAVEELYVDDRAWTVRYLGVRTGGWLSGCHVLVVPDSVREIDDRRGTMQLNLTRAQIESSPPTDRAATISPRV